MVAIQKRIGQDNFIYDPSLVLYLPLWKRDGASFMSDDAYGHLCTVTGASWTPSGRSSNGVSDKIEMSDHASLNLTTAITVEVWVSPDATNPASYGRYLGKTNAANNLNSYAIGMEVADETNVRWDLTGLSVLNSGTGKVIPSVFNHIVGTYKNSGANNNIIYIKGVNVASATETASITTKDGVLRLYNGAGTTQWWKGIIGEVRIYNRALSPLEVQQNYLATKWRYQ